MFVLFFWFIPYRQYKRKTGTGIANGRKSKVQHQTQDALNSLLLTL
jgi:hypothetical protein